MELGRSLTASPETSCTLVLSHDTRGPKLPLASSGKIVGSASHAAGMKFRCEGAVYEDGARRISPGHTANVTVRQNSLEVRLASMPYYATLAIAGVTANSVMTENVGGLLKAPEADTV
jgi:hypothetical protein